MKSAGAALTLIGLAFILVYLPMNSDFLDSDAYHEGMVVEEIRGRREPISILPQRRTTGILIGGLLAGAGVILVLIGRRKEGLSSA